MRQAHLLRGWTTQSSSSMMSTGAKLLRGWMVFNAMLDLVPLGIVPLVTGKAGMLADMMPTLVRNDLARRLSAWTFLKDAAPRMAAGWLAFTSDGAPVALDALAMYSYASEFMLYLCEVFVFKTTTFEQAVGCFVIPGMCVLGLASGMLASNKLSKD